MQTNLIDDLVLRPEAKEMIKALSRSYTTQAEGGGPDGRWSADFVRNKGEGQIFLLHGKPGVGKTTTAECVAELTNRPLLSLTCGDLGIQPLDVERELKKWLRLAKTWEAILLLDEADVYLENRYAHDLQRNSLVSIFLRALEYYQGILFLTTNRVGTFDDGFVSRIHVIIHYPEFTDEERSRIWEIFFRKLEKERDNIRVLQRTIDYAKDATKDLHWNGREIRNGMPQAPINHSES
jgi:SpoVK/Ycf46/Vps4 family AAA+-type ATPase